MRLTLRVLMSVAIALAVGIAATALWHRLTERASENFAKHSESVSYAARSELVRDLQVQIKALQDVARYWATYGHLSADQWNHDAQVELNHFEGIEVILWNDAQSGTRYATAPDDFSFSRRPSDEQWDRYRSLLQGLRESDGLALLGPVQAGDGDWTYRIQIALDRPVSSGVLVALVNTRTLLTELLRDRSPGYATAVYWGDVLLHQFNEPATGVPQRWIREGQIKLPTGTLWRVVHTPTPELMQAQNEPAIPALLAAGWAIAALLGLLAFQNGQVRQRARAAEAAEKRIAALNTDLERQVAQRTRELAERTSDLETISESVVHDLRNPLNSIAMNVQLLSHQLDETDGSAGERPKLLETIQRAGAQMAAILDRLHAFSSVSFAPFRREIIDMERLVRMVFDEVAAAEPAPVPELRIGEIPHCSADKTMVRILLLNLIGNACKYSRRVPQRYVAVTATSSDDGTVYSVTDNGVGFDPEEAERLFEPFLRSGDDGDVDGRGVGLAVVARIVHRHGGRIWANGEPGAGATFCFHLNDGAHIALPRADAA